MEDLAKKLNITSPEGWYKINVDTLLKNGAAGFLPKYKNSPSKLIKTIYPEYRKSYIVFSNEASSPHIRLGSIPI